MTSAGVVEICVSEVVHNSPQKLTGGPETPWGESVFVPPCVHITGHVGIGLSRFLGCWWGGFWVGGCWGRRKDLGGGRKRAWARRNSWVRWGLGYGKYLQITRDTFALAGHSGAGGEERIVGESWKKERHPRGAPEFLQT